MSFLPQNAVDQVYLNCWLGTARQAVPATSNQAASSMPYQRWFKFKEAFAPSFVVEVINRLPYTPERCLDPFGGSGTTALTCQFLGIEPVTIEANPFLADVIESKLARYDPAELRYASRTLSRAARRNLTSTLFDPFPGAPSTFVEPGDGNRWIFDRDVARAVVTLRSQIGRMTDAAHRRFFRVILGSKLVEVSNVIVNGKGRRYRGGWRNRKTSAEDVFATFEQACSVAVADVESFQRRNHPQYTLIRGDARELLSTSPAVDFILTSPPYPNSFDYTDIYNLELWALGYLKSGADNRALRESGIRSHVQIAHNGQPLPTLSPTLSVTYQALVERRKHLWNKRIPEMVCHYFEDIHRVLEGCRKVLKQGGQFVMAVGDSRYDGVLVDVPQILSEMVNELGLNLIGREAVRSMRASAQQGGIRVLNESLLWLSS